MQLVHKFAATLFNTMIHKQFKNDKKGFGKFGPLAEGRGVSTLNLLRRDVDSHLATCAAPRQGIGGLLRNPKPLLTESVMQGFSSLPSTYCVLSSSSDAQDVTELLAPRVEISHAFFFASAKANFHTRSSATPPNGRSLFPCPVSCKEDF